MGRHLLISVHVHGDGQGTARFHGFAQGNPEWPPSPARVFQALVAGVAHGGGLPEAIVPAFEWFETLPPPVIVAPCRKVGESVNLFVPNNDADEVADPRDVSRIRTKKVVRPSLFPEGHPFLYVWRLSDDARFAEAIVAATSHLYQLGRGVDMAWASGEVLSDSALAERLAEHPGTVHRPELGHRSERLLACPTPGSLVSLERRHRAAKLVVEGTGRGARTFFTNPPKPRFLHVSYDRVHTHVVFELRDRERNGSWPWAPGRVVHLVEKLRDAATSRLLAALPERAAAIDGMLVGRKSEGHGSTTHERVRIVPLPSIGSVHADRGIRRFLVDVPSGAPLSAGDVEWAFSGLEWTDSSGKSSPWIVTRATDDGMIRHYVGPSRRWQSVTAMALPESARRRRIEPTHRHEVTKTAQERRDEAARARAAVRDALRHAGVRERAFDIRVQREPFETKELRADEFAAGTRFPRERLWHVSIEFERPIDGPLVLGDGRFLGLGIMAPRPESKLGVHAFRIDDGIEGNPSAGLVTRALRRAVMARVQREMPLDVALPPFFSGHDEDGGPVRRAREAHLAFAFDAYRSRVLVLAPHVIERRDPSLPELEYLRILDASLVEFRELVAGRVGRLRVSPTSAGFEGDALFGQSKTWGSVTPYVVTRHAKNLPFKRAIEENVRAECRRLALPDPTQVEVDRPRGVSRLGLVGDVMLTFRTPIRGPVLMGRDRHFGGGLFRAMHS